MPARLPLAKAAAAPRPGCDQDRRHRADAWRGRADWLWPLLAAALYLAGALSDLRVPGLYMDAVNPDYLVVRLLQAGPERIAVWMPPGNMLFDRFPVLGQIYHGALPYWLGLPGYLLFGTDVAGVRIVQSGFGLLVLGAAWWFLRACGTAPVAAGLALAGLALEPAFFASFRTQFYITLLPMACLLGAAALTTGRDGVPSARRLAAAGCLAGLSVYGYFIYAFLLPACLGLAVAATWPQPRRLLPWLAGLALGLTPYALGFGLMLAATGGPAGFRQTLAGTVQALDPGASRLGLGARLALGLDYVRGALRNTGNTAMLLQAAPGSIGGMLRPLLLGLLALAGLVLIGVKMAGRVPGTGSTWRGLQFCAGLLAGFLALVLAFGNRVWLHHFAGLPVVAYLAAGLGLGALQACFGRGGLIAAVVVMLPLLAVNAADRQGLLWALRTTGGVGLASDAMSRFAEDSIPAPRPTHVVLPDWGVFMGFAMITRGSLPYSLEAAPAPLRARLCQGQDILMALLVEPRAERAAALTRELGWDPPVPREYRQRDGTPLLLALRWAGAAPGDPRCP